MDYVTDSTRQFEVNKLDSNCLFDVMCRDCGLQVRPHSDVTRAWQITNKVCEPHSTGIPVRAQQYPSLWRRDTQHFHRVRSGKR